jgi:hypothetical protein
LGGTQLRHIYGRRGGSTVAQNGTPLFMPDTICFTYFFENKNESIWELTMHIRPKYLELRAIVITVVLLLLTTVFVASD